MSYPTETLAEETRKARFNLVVVEGEGGEGEEDEGVELGRKIQQETSATLTPTTSPPSCVPSLLLPAGESLPLTNVCTLPMAPQLHPSVPLFPPTTMAWTHASRSRRPPLQQSQRSGVGT